MAYVDRHRKCFEPETYSDWPRRRATPSKTRNRKAMTDKITRGRLTRKKECARKIDFASPAPDPVPTFSAVQASGTKDVARMGGVRGFLARALHFVIYFLVPRAYRFVTSAFH
ncbi:hypothetical protein MTO96_019412 [Rhipicephalus appendiculatus]